MQRITNMNKSLAAVFLLGCLVVSGCNDNNPLNSDRNFVAKKTFSYEVEVLNHTRLNLEGVAGTISITGVSGSNSVKITGEKRVESFSRNDAEEELQKLEVRVQDSANEVFVKTIQPDNANGRQYIVDYTITLPENLEVLVANVSGNVSISSIHNTVRANIVSGMAKLRGIVGSAFVSTVSSNIVSQITLPLDGTIELGAVSGNVELEIPKSTSAKFSATVVSGKIRVSNLVLENIVQTEKSLQGTCNGGRGTVSLNAVSGNIGVQGY